MLKIVAIAFAALIVLLGAAVAAVVIGGDPFIGRFVERHASTFLGRDIRMGGFDIAWGNPVRIVVEDLHVANASWGSAPEMLAARRLELEIRPWPLLRGGIVIPRLAVDGPRLLLETSADGEKNWNFFAAKSATPKKRSGFPDLHRVDVTSGAFTWRNGKTKAVTEIAIGKLGVAAPDRASPVAIAAEGRFQNRPFRGEATVGALAQLQDTTKPYPVKASGSVGQTRAAVEGTIAEPLDVEGVDARAEVDGPDLKEIMDTLGLPAFATPQYHFAGKVSHTGDRWAVDEVDGRIGKSAFRGGIAVEVGEGVPHVEANLVSTYLDLADFKGFYGGEPKPKEQAKPPQQKAQEKAAQEKGGRVIPNAHLPIDRLPGIDADIAIDAAQVKPTAGLPFERVNLGIALKDGTLRVKPLRFAIAKGDVSGEVLLAAKQRPPRIEADIGIRHIDMHQLVGGMELPKYVKELAGHLGGFVKLKSQGTTEHELLAAANGDVGLFMEEGEFSHLLIELFDFDIAEALGFWAKGDKPHPVNCVVTRFDVKDGVATASTFLIDTTDTAVDGKGNINFGSETLYLDLTPHPKDWSPFAVRAPLEVRGTFGAPKVRPNMLDLGARIGAAIGLGVLAPPAALLPFIEIGLGEQNACSKAYAAQPPPQQPPAAGSSTPNSR